MKAKILWYDQDEEQLEKYETMGIKPPEPEPIEGELFFSPEDVVVTYINSGGKIALHTLVGTWVVEYDKTLWDMLKGFFR